MPLPPSLLDATGDGTAAAAMWMDGCLGVVFGYKGVLLLFGMLLVYETRSIKFSQINDSRLVSTSMCNIVVRFDFLLQSFLPVLALAPVLHTCALLLQKSRHQCVCMCV